MSKIATTKPLLIMLYGLPGSGKTHFAAEMAKHMQAAHVQADRIRYELFEQPRYDKQEDEIVSHLMGYMTEEFLSAGVNVIFDANMNRLVDRRALRDTARKLKAETLLIWLQIDKESAVQRIAHRDRRRNNDKFARSYNKASFNEAVGAMQQPKNEDYVVISGKHTFNTQKTALIKKLYAMGVINAENVSANVAKPGLVNLVPTAGRVDMDRRNVVIR